MKNKIKLNEITRSKGKTDWGYLKRNKEPKINDLNAPILTDYELNQLKKVVRKY